MPSVLLANFPFKFVPFFSPGGYRVQGKEKAARSAEQLLEQSLAAEQAGASLIVLECVPTKLAKQISESIKIPTIGIGAGVECDGQILVVPQNSLKLSF
jgi:3-methyl-2-oxobutanoate hydroxymethyltransferase